MEWIGVLLMLAVLVDALRGHEPGPFTGVAIFISCVAVYPS